MAERDAAGRRAWGLAALDAALPFLGLALFVGLWVAAAHYLVPPTSFLSRFAPDRTAAALYELVSTGQAWPHLLASLRRVAVGLAVAVAVGFPLGLLVGRSRRFARASGPLFQFVRMVSPLAWTPLAIILFGVGDAPVYFLIAVGGTWPVMLNTAAAVQALDPRWLTVARSLGATPWESARTILWPGIRPQVLTGIRLAVGLAWIILVPAEMLGVDSGLGYFILDTRDRLAYAELMAAIVVVGLCGFAIDSLARWALAERRGARRGAAARAATPWSTAPAGPARHAAARSAE